jgi:hypothetical protein
MIVLRSFAFTLVLRSSFDNQQATVTRNTPTRRTSTLGA